MSLSKYIKTKAGEAPRANKPAKTQGLRTFVNDQIINKSNKKNE